MIDRETERRSRLVAERAHAAADLAGLEIEKAGVDNERAKAAADAGPVRYLATLIGIDQETVTRWFILCVALTLDPAALLLLLAAT